MSLHASYVGVHTTPRGDRTPCLRCGRHRDGRPVLCKDCTDVTAELGELHLWGHDGPRADTCPAGHEFTPENTYHRPGPRRGRMCRKCISERRRRYKHKEAT